MKITNPIIGAKFDPLTSKIWSVVAFPEVGKAPLPHQRGKIIPKMTAWRAIGYFSLMMH